MKSIIIFAAIIGLSYERTTTYHNVDHTHGAHTNAPHTTHEPSVVQQYVFHYDDNTDYMVVHKDENCYLFYMSDHDRMNVHTDAGLTALEVWFLQLILSGSMSETDNVGFEHSIVQACGANIQHYYTIA